MKIRRKVATELTDEQVLREFVRRFECDGAVLIYLDSDAEFGFGRWVNSVGKNWVDNLFSRIKQPVYLTTEHTESEGGKKVNLSVN
ncbi:MAG: hypothetical protein BGO21_26220 [Dyadobacter sp. 50-39]|uniref:hypothetical protein n=1 Tax=Dyadobacter sp. 50-39 TaxID=1895756 RepID=UPI000960D8A4|nr:hypothetical protein [Dyadobacter sp. 50-39]OJV16397.1 MAG: hypothetical protein BGO21_26220 [Dyadobacter sp. 50-39]